MFWSVRSCTIFSTLPKCCSSSRSNSYTSLLLLFHPIHSCCTVMDFSNVVLFTCVVKNAFRTSCLTCINVSHDAKVTIKIERIFACHLLAPFSLLPAIMTKCFICICHFVSVFTFLNGRATAVDGIHQFSS